MDGGHQTLLNAELPVHDHRQRSQTVGGAGGVGNDLHVAGVGIAVDAVDKHRRAVLGGSGNDDLFGAAGKMGARLFRRGIHAGGIENILRADARPRDQACVRLAEHLDPAAVDDQILVITLDRAVERPKHRIVFEQIDHLRNIRLAKVDRANLELLRLQAHNTQRHPPDTAKSVDTDLNHVSTSSKTVLLGDASPQRFAATYYSKCKIFVSSFSQKR